MYNPFAPFTDGVFRQTLREDTYLYATQRSGWPRWRNITVIYRSSCPSTGGVELPIEEVEKLKG